MIPVQCRQNVGNFNPLTSITMTIGKICPSLFAFRGDVLNGEFSRCMLVLPKTKRMVETMMMQSRIELFR